MRAFERLLRYVTVFTASDENEPAANGQRALGAMLVDELLALGVSDAMLDADGYVYGHLPATDGCKNAPRLGFVAHMDTAPDFNGDHVRPRVIERYDGAAVPLGAERTLSPAQFPHLEKLKGRTLIVTDGTSLLGGDDKSGIAEIMTLIERLQTEQIPHGPLSFCFTPDEEIGQGADRFDLERFAADYAYTVDGGVEGEVVYENFNACSAEFVVHGFNVHPGDAKNIMLNAQLIAMEINALLPGMETPSHTEQYEGFYHLCDMSGNVERATLSYIVRDHSAAAFDARKATLRLIEKCLNEKYGQGTVELVITEQYRNMEEMIRPHYHLIENAIAATKEAGVAVRIVPIRGGTDGARLSYMGLPCPNLGTGGFACHGPYEHVTAEGMDACVEILLNIQKRYAAMERA